MRKIPLALLCSIMFAATSVAGPYFFPKLRPLFVGLDEAKVPAKAHRSLERAKVDFQLARHGQAPRFAAYVGERENPRGKVYRGRGYEVTLVHEQGPFALLNGPKIVLDSSVTGGQPYRYDEIDQFTF